MSNKQKFKSDAFEAIHSSADALLKVGAINKATMREFDQSCLTTLVEFDPQQIKRLREDNHMKRKYSVNP
jgi:putative transcriptional regulator